MTQKYLLSTQNVKDAFVQGRLGLYTEIPVEAIARNEENFERWLSTHDAQIRAEALEFSKEEDGEACLALGAALNEQGVGPDKRSPNSIQLNPVVRAISLAVSRYRKEQQR